LAFSIKCLRNGRKIFVLQTLACLCLTGLIAYMAMEVNAGNQGGGGGGYGT